MNSEIGSSLPEGVIIPARMSNTATIGTPSEDMANADCPRGAETSAPRLICRPLGLRSKKKPPLMAAMASPAMLLVRASRASPATGRAVRRRMPASHALLRSSSMTWIDHGPSVRWRA